MSKYYREQKQFKTILGIKKLGKSLNEIWGKKKRPTGPSSGPHPGDERIHSDVINSKGG